MIFDVDDVYEIEESYETKLEKKDKEIETLKSQLQQKENKEKEIREYIEKDTRWFDSEYVKTYGELCTCAGAKGTRLELLLNPSNLLKILDEDGGKNEPNK